MTREQLKRAWPEKFYSICWQEAEEIHQRSPDHLGEPSPDLVLAVAIDVIGRTVSGLYEKIEEMKATGLEP